MAFLKNIGADRATLLVTGCLSLLLWISGPASAQDDAPVAELQPLQQKVAAQFDQMQAEIELQKEDIQRLER